MRRRSPPQPSPVYRGGSFHDHVGLAVERLARGGSAFKVDPQHAHVVRLNRKVEIELEGQRLVRPQREAAGFATQALATGFDARHLHCASAGVAEGEGLGVLGALFDAAEIGPERLSDDGRVLKSGGVQPRRSAGRRLTAGQGQREKENPYPPPCAVGAAAISGWRGIVG